MSTASFSGNMERVFDDAQSTPGDPTELEGDTVYYSGGGVKSITRSRFKNVRSDIRIPSREPTRLRKKDVVWPSSNGVSSVHRTPEGNYSTNELPAIKSFKEHTMLPKKSSSILYITDGVDWKSAHSQVHKRGKTPEAVSNTYSKNEYPKLILPEAETDSKLLSSKSPSKSRILTAPDLHPELHLRRGPLDEMDFKHGTSDILGSLGDMDLEPSTWESPSLTERVDVEPSISRISSPAYEAGHQPRTWRIPSPFNDLKTEHSTSKILDPLDEMDSEPSTSRTKRPLDAMDLECSIPRVLGKKDGSRFHPINIEDDSDGGQPPADLSVRGTSTVAYFSRNKLRGNSSCTSKLVEPVEPNDGEGITYRSSLEPESDGLQSSSITQHPAKVLETSSLVDQLRQNAVRQGNKTIPSNSSISRKRKRGYTSESSMSGSTSEYIDRSTRASTEPFNLFSSDILPDLENTKLFRNPTVASGQL